MNRSVMKASIGTKIFVSPLYSHRRPGPQKERFVDGLKWLRDEDYPNQKISTVRIVTK